MLGMISTGKGLLSLFKATIAQLIIIRREKSLTDKNIRIMFSDLFLELQKPRSGQQDMLFTKMRTDSQIIRSIVFIQYYPVATTFSKRKMSTVSLFRRNIFDCKNIFFYFLLVIDLYIRQHNIKTIRKIFCRSLKIAIHCLFLLISIGTVFGNLKENFIGLL